MRGTPKAVEHVELHAGHSGSLLSPPRRRQLHIAGALALGAACSAFALPTPATAVVLTVAGRVRGGSSEPNSTAQGLARFDMAMLAALPQHSFTTTTPWYANARRFSGPLLRDVLAAAGAQGDLLRLIALNGYRVDMPYVDTQRFDVLMARLLDGQPMAVRDKGPLFVVYPFDSLRELHSAIYYSRSAWQLRRIDVL